MSIENIPPAPLPKIDENGLTLPLFTEIHEWWKTVHKEIYGQDIYIENDSQDGQYIGVTAKAFHDLFSVVEAIYNAFSPSSAQGVGLSRVIKINGIRRKIPTRSSVDLRIIGQPGTQIVKGRASDPIGARWVLPDLVTIPPSAEIIATALAEEEGEQFSPPNTVTTIETTTRGWQSVNNPEASTTGMPIEYDPMVRVRQSLSVALPSKSHFESLVGAVAAVEGTNRYRGYENETTGDDDRGLPQNSTVLVVEGGDNDEIAEVIYKKKAPGTMTWGTTNHTYIDAAGIPHKIYYSRPRQAPVVISIPIKPLANFTATKDLAVRTAVANWVNSHIIGDHIYVEEIPTPARLITPQFPEGDPTFKILPEVKVARYGTNPISANLMIDFDERVTTTALDVILEYSQQ